MLGGFSYSEFLHILSDFWEEKHSVSIANVREQVAIIFFLF